MQALHSKLLKVMVPAACVLATAIGAALLIPGTKPLYGQAGGDKIPNMVGVWKGELSGYIFNNVADPGCKLPEDITKPQCQPQFFRDPEPWFEVTVQNERAFASLGAKGGTVGRLTGVVSSDGTVIMQSFSPTELRVFLTGILTFANGTYEINGQGHAYDDFGLRPPENTKGMMASCTFHYVKVN